MKTKLTPLLVSVVAWIKLRILRREFLYGALFLAVLITVVLQLSVVPEGAAEIERNTYSSASNLESISKNPLSLPYKLVGLGAHYISDSIRIFRAIGLVFFGCTIVALYRILKRWHSDKIALLASAMYATNATGLAVARLASPLVLLLGWSLIISIMLWIQHGESRKIAPIAIVLIIGFSVYVPGALYFLTLLFILFFRKIKKTILSLRRKTAALAIVVSLAFLAPLLWSFTQDMSLLREWLLLPPSIDWVESARNILRVPSAFIYRSPVDPLLSVGRLPVFDLAVGGLFLIGLYVYQQNYKLERTKVILLTALLAIIIGALGQVTAAIIILLPFVYAVAAAGISYLLDEWYKVFPKNPFARSFGLLVMTFVVLMTMYYQTTRFLVVWPQTPETRAQYNQSRLVQ